MGVDRQKSVICANHRVGKLLNNAGNRSKRRFAGICCGMWANTRGHMGTGLKSRFSALVMRGTCGSCVADGLPVGYVCGLWVAGVVVRGS